MKVQQQRRNITFSNGLSNLQSGRASEGNHIPAADNCTLLSFAYV